MVSLPSGLRYAASTVLMSSIAATLAFGVPSIASAQSADVALQKYSSVLQQIADRKLSIQQNELFVTQQGDEISSLRTQIKNVGPVKDGVDETLDKMAAQLEDAINSDFPFLLDERLARVEKLKEDIKNPEIEVGTKYRQALNAYKIEVNYGQGVESYEGERPLNSDEQPIMISTLDDKGEEMIDAKTGEVVIGPEMGTYLRYGRVSLVYMNQRADSARRYDLPSKKWVDLSGASLQNARKAIRISKGETAPSVVFAQTYVGN